MADNAELRIVAGASNDFADDFSRTLLRGNHGNMISSPLSLYVVLAQASYGARGETAAQIRGALHLPSDDFDGHSGFKSLIKTLDGVSDVELHVANKTYVAYGFHVKKEFQTVLETDFLSTGQELDFSNSLNAANTINTWCEKATNNRLKEVVAPDDFNDSTKLLLVNAVYFKGEWVKPFHPEQTRDEPFHTSETVVKDVPTMSMRGNFVHGSIPELDARFVELPYKGDEFSMVIILPNQINGLDSVTDRMQKLKLGDIVQRGTNSKIDLYLPKFKVESKLDLTEVLTKMGMVNMFDERKADFSGIADGKMAVSKIIQKAFIEVNEEGSEAAAFSMVGVCLKSSNYTPPEPFHVNHPFKYIICHRNHGIYSLFDGVIRQPTWT